MSKSDIVKELTSIGKFSNFQLKDKATLIKLLNDYKSTGIVPNNFMKKHLLGDKCKQDNECRTKKCIDNVCVSKNTKKSLVLNSKGKYDVRSLVNLE